MSDQAILAKIHARRQEIADARANVAAEIKQLGALDASLQQEETELRITERHILKFAVGELERPTTELAARVLAKGKEQEAAQRGKRKPKGLPNVLVMARAVMADSAEQGRHWLEPVEIVTQIRKRWQWPELEVGFISPQLWRAARKGKLLKDGTRYALLASNEKAPDSVAAGAPQSNGAADLPQLST